MTEDQVAVSAILALTTALFLHGRLRHDVVAMLALLGCVALGLTAAEAAFSGFSHPAVVTVACVLILSHGLQTSGAVDVAVRRLLPRDAGPAAAMAGLTLIAAALSGFMNNVGALALLMPVALQVAARTGAPPGRLLMPLAFGSILGGMTTLIGTPSNLIVSAHRAGLTEAGPFRMFDFAPVGAAVAAAGAAFIIVTARWLVPARARASAEGFDTGAYLTEARTPKGARAVGMTLTEVEAALEKADAQALGMVRRGVRLRPAPPWTRVEPDDILLLEAEPDGLVASLSELGLTLEEDRKGDREPASERGREPARERPEPGPESRREVRHDAPAGSREAIALHEYAVLPGSQMIGRNAGELRLRTRYGVNLLAVSRQGRRSISRLRSTPARSGDVLLMQGPPDALASLAADMGLAPLAERALRLPSPRKAALAAAIMAASVAAASLGLAPAAIAFAAGALLTVLADVTPARSVYDAVDWSVIVLLGALIPVAEAVAATGAAEAAARQAVAALGDAPPLAALALVLTVTTALTSFINNAATAALMAPVAAGVAAGVGADADAFLMAVAIGASCAFLTPIGHQNGTLILGPGGFRFGDYWRLGLPLTAVAFAVAIPMLALVWPL